MKSALGIGCLLAEGTGDTIRVSLSEDPAAEVPVAREIVDHVNSISDAPSIEGETAPGYDSLCPERRKSSACGLAGGGQVPVAVGVDITGKIAESLFTIDASAVPDEIPAGAIVVIKSSHKTLLPKFSPPCTGSWPAAWKIP